MKKFDFNRKFKNYQGIETEESPTIADELAKLLYSLGVEGLQATPDEKFPAYKIATLLISGKGEIELSQPDCDLIKKFCGYYFTAGAYGQIVELLNN
jgi:hypothetical protein